MSGLQGVDNLTHESENLGYEMTKQAEMEHYDFLGIKINALLFVPSGYFQLMSNTWNAVHWCPSEVPITITHTILIPTMRFTIKSFLIITIYVLLNAALLHRILRVLRLRVSSFDGTFESPNISSQLHQKQEKEVPIEKMLTVEEKQIKIWLEKKNGLNTNVDRVCKKYGKAISKDVDTRNIFMFDPEHNLLFCRNAKVN